MNYNPWPLGHIPKELQRPEIAQLKENGYEFQDAREVVGIFEKKVATFAGCRFAVAVDCCSHGLFLCLKYLQINGPYSGYITIPDRTYVSVPLQILYAGFKPKFEYRQWEGIYTLEPTNIIDAAVRWKRGMYIPKSLMVLSFQIKKTIPIGKGGMILTDDPEAYKILKLMSYDGRDLDTPYDSEDHIKRIGYHYYMEPESAARGILLMDAIKTEGDAMSFVDYPRVDKMLKHIL